MRRAFQFPEDTTRKSMISNTRPIDVALRQSKL